MLRCLQAVASLAHEKQQLQERLLQAHAFISCLQQRTQRAPAAAAVLSEYDSQHSVAAVMQTPTDCTPAAAANATPQFAAVHGGSIAAPAARDDSRQAMLALPAPAAGGAQSSYVQHNTDHLSTAARGNAYALAGLPATPGSQLVSQRPCAAQSATAVIPQDAGAWLQEPVSPILAAAARSRAVGQERQLEQQSAASHELRDVQVEQLGLREEISRAKSALADIAGQLRASIGHTAEGGLDNAAAPSVARSVSQGRVGVPHSTTSSKSRSTSGVMDQRKAAASGAPTSSSSSSSCHNKDTATPASTGSRAAPERSHGPVKLQQLHKAAAAVKSASAARSSSSARSTSHVSRGAVTSGAPVSSLHLAAQAGSIGGRASQKDSSHQWDQMSESGSSSGTPMLSRQTASSVARPAVNAPAAAVGTASAGPGYIAAGRDAADSHSGRVPCWSAPAAAAASSADSGRGSISLDQLIADAESVSLEYGMSPGAYAVGSTPASAGGSTGMSEHVRHTAARSAEAAAAIEGSSMTPQQQGSSAALPGPQQFAFMASQVGMTPGSAASSAGAAGRRLDRHDEAFHFDMTPVSVAGAAFGAEDMQSCMRPAAPGGFQQRATPTAATPAGLERVASNTMLDALAAAADSPAPSVLLGQQQQGSTPELATHNSLVGVMAAASDAAGASSSVQQPAVNAEVSTNAASTAQAAMVEATAGSGQGSAAQGTFSFTVQQETQQQEYEHAAFSSAGQQAQQQDAVTPVKAATGSSATAGALGPVGSPISSPPSALKKAAAALLSSISPAGLVTAAATPEAVASGTAAAAFAAGLSPQLLQHLTPEWLRSLKRKCKQESEQLQQLRRQMGLATPEVHVPAEVSTGLQQQGTVAAASLAGSTVVEHDAAVQAGSSLGVLGAAPAAAALVPAASQQVQAPAATSSSIDTALLGLHTPGGAAAVSSSDVQHCGGSSSRATSVAPHTGTSLGQASSRSNIDRLRRRAIMSQAAAAAANPAGEPSAAVAGVGAAAGAGAGVAAGLGLGVSGAAGSAGLRMPSWSTTDTASLDDPIDRTDSTGSLAEYMRNASLRSADVSAPTSRTGSATPGMLPARPECPTPGSVYSDITDTLRDADDALSGRDSPVSPDLLLAGLRSSRMAARQLQQQLMQQLEKTTSMPAMLPRQQEAALVAVLGGSGLARTNSAAVHVAAAEDDGVAATPPLSAVGEVDPAAGDAGAGDTSSCCDTPVLHTSTELLAVPAEIDRIRGEAAAVTGSPATPGAVLNAGAESRLLSPSVQLQLVFDEEGGAVDQGVCPDEAQSSMPQQQQELQQQQPKASQPSSGSPQASDSSSCMVPLGVVAKAQPQADAAVLAPSPPASTLSVTPGTISKRAASSKPTHQTCTSRVCYGDRPGLGKQLPAYTCGGKCAFYAAADNSRAHCCCCAHTAPATAGYSGHHTAIGSIRAHQLSNLSAGTFSASAAASVRQEDSHEQQSCARAAVAAAFAAINPGTATGAGAGAYGGDAQRSMSAASCGSRRTVTHSITPGSSRAASSAGPSLGSWTGTAAAAAPAFNTPGDITSHQTEVAELMSASGTSQPTPCMHSSSLQQHDLESASVSKAASSSARPADSQQEQPTATKAFQQLIALGESPSSKPQPQQQQQQSGSIRTGAGSEASPSSVSTMSGTDCMSSLSIPGRAGVRPSLGASPGSADGTAAADTAGESPESAPVSTVATEPICVAASVKAASGTAGRVPDPSPASAALAAAFAVPQAAVTRTLHIQQAPAAAAAAAAVPKPAAAAEPAASSTTWGSGSCMFATPAAAFASPGGTQGAASDGSGQQYYTGLQGTGASSRRPAAHSVTTAATSQQTEVTGGGAEHARRASPTEAFAGFSMAADANTATSEGPSSPVIGGATARASASAGIAAPAGTATAQKRMLRMLLDSPGDSGGSCSGEPSPASPAVPQLQSTAGAAAGPLYDQINPQSAEAEDGAAACQSPQQGTSDAGDMAHQKLQVVSSPTLSELGFVAASASADVADAKRLQQQQQKQEGGEGRAAGDLDGLSFEQRLQLLCTDNGSASPSSSMDGSISPQPEQYANDANDASAADAAEQQEEGPVAASSSHIGSASGQEVGWGASAVQAAGNQPDTMSGMVSTGVHGSSSACCATQTSPLPYGVGPAQVGAESLLIRHALLVVLQCNSLHEAAAAAVTCCVTFFKQGHS